MDSKQLLKDILSDIRVELLDEFDKNFERKGFFGNRWPPRKFQNNRGTLLMQSGKLRRSIQATVGSTSVTFTSSEPYAAIHNEGGKIKVTEKMRKYFWAKYAETKDEQWKWLALKKVGSTLTIPERRFIGDAPEVKKIVEDIIAENVERGCFSCKYKQISKAIHN